MPLVLLVIVTCLFGGHISLPAQTGGIDDAPGPLKPWVELSYPDSRVIRGVQFDKETHRKEAEGSDIWPITWADDDHQYAAFGDGGGFGGDNKKGRVSMGVARIEGGYDKYVGKNVWGGMKAENPAQFQGKGTGILSVKGVLYMWVSKQPKMLSQSVLAVSHDHARSWQLAEWNLKMEDGVYAGAFVNCGRDYADAPDRYVYACFMRVEPAPAEPRSWVYERPGRIDLMRAPKDRLVEQSAWEWFAGEGQNGEVHWSSDIHKRRFIFADPNGIKVASLCYQPALRRYLLTYNPRDTGGNFALFEAPNPWGPWSKVVYLKGERVFMPPKPNQRVSIYHFAPKWWSADGKEFTLVYNVGDDAWNTIRGRFELSQENK